MVALFLLLLTIALVVWLTWACDVFGREATTLNLRVYPRYSCALDIFIGALRTTPMAQLGDTFTAKIDPKNTAGASAPVFSAEYAANGGYEITPATDGLSAVVVAVSSGTGFTLTCTATSKHGVVLTETVPLADVDVAVDDEAVSLNLTVA